MNNVNAYALSNIGNVRDNHEDNFYIPNGNYISAKEQCKIKSNDITIEYEYTGKDGLFVVCDGMGGHNAGEVASRIAIETVSKKYNEILTDEKEKLLNFIKTLNNDLCKYSEDNQDCNNMGTTFAGLVVFNDVIHIINVGDSRIYKFENNELIQISKDHTEGKRLLDAGIIKKEDLTKMPNHKSLYKYLGRKCELVADCEQIKILSNTKIIISSDGLTDTLKNDEIREVLEKYNSTKEICHSLLKKCLEKKEACNDNVTIICINFY